MAASSLGSFTVASVGWPILVALSLACRPSGGGGHYPQEPAPKVERVEELLIGKYAGVEVLPTGDGGYTVHIRGMDRGAPPLWVIDGTQLEVRGSRDLAWLNPADVVKIEVLKNPSDIGVYGLRGNNGVIVVTTKRPGRR